MERLKYILKDAADFEEQLLVNIISCFRPKTIKKKTILLLGGEVCKEFYYIKKGCLRLYFIDKKGHEKTRFVLFEGTVGTALDSFIFQKPSFEFIDALEDSELLAISHKDFYRLNKELIPWKILYQKILEVSYSNQIKKIEDLVTLTAKQRYDHLVKENPVLLQRLSNKVLASYLDIREETLSRLKSK
jgi:CRP-like cAMP-binding protein